MIAKEKERDQRLVQVMVGELDQIWKAGSIIRLRYMGLQNLPCRSHDYGSTRRIKGQQVVRRNLM